MEITVNSGESLTLAIKKALITRENAKESSFNGSIWNKILDIVDKQNQENINSNKEALYKGGSVRKPANWQKNYKVFAGQKLEFSDESWDKIKEIVGLKVEKQQESNRKPPEPVQEKPVQIDIPEPQLDKTEKLPYIHLPQDNSVSNGKKQVQSQPDTIPVASKPQDNIVNSAELPELKLHVDKEELKNKEVLNVPLNRSITVHKKKSKSSNDVNVVKNSDGSITTTSVTTENDGTRVETSQKVKEVVYSRFINKHTIIETTKTSSDGNVITKTTGSEIEKIHKNKDFIEIKKGPTTTVTTTKNPDGTKTVSSVIMPESGFIRSSDVKQGSYTIDTEGNIISQNNSGITVKISPAQNNSNGSYSTIATITDSVGQKTTIPVNADNSSVYGYVHKDNNEENFNIMMGDVARAITGLKPEVLADLKSEISSINIQTEDFLPIGINAAGYYKNDSIVLTVEGNGLKTSTLNHELGHAIDADNKHHNHSNTYSETFDTLKNQLKDSGIKTEEYYALTNPKEFFAEFYAGKYGNGKDSSKTLFNKLAAADDAQIKSTYQNLINQCEQILKNTRNQNPEQRMGAFNRSNSWIDQNRERIIQVFGADAQMIRTEDELYKLYLENKNSKQAQELFNEFLSTGDR